MRIQTLLIAAVHVVLLSVVLPATVAGADGWPHDDAEAMFDRVTRACGVQFLGKDDKVDVPEKYRDYLLDPGPHQRFVGAMALDALPDLACKAVKRIAFVKIGLPQGAKGLTDDRFPDLIIVGAAVGATVASENELNVRYTFNTERPAGSGNMSAEQYFRQQLAKNLTIWPQTIQAILHEAAHCASYLLDSASDSSEIRNVWDAGAVSEARRIVENLGLQGGVLSEWRRMNEVFAREDMALAYDDTRVQDSKMPAVLGYLTHYGGHDAKEDIAEAISWLQFLRVYKDLQLRDIETLDLGWYPDVQPFLQFTTDCEELSQTTDGGVTLRFAAIYTKLNFLLDSELVTEQEVQSCVGSGKVGIRPGGVPAGNGFHRVDYQTREYMYTHRDIRPGFPVSASALPTFRILGTGVLTDEAGKTHDTTMSLDFVTTEKPSIPRGFYRIRGLLVVCAGPQLGSEATFELTVQDAPSMSFCAVSGNVLITRASRAFIEGSMFIGRAKKEVLVPIPEVPNFRVYLHWKRPGSR